MASAKFLEEALNTHVDESAINDLVGSLENQLGTATQQPHSGATSQLQPNHVNSAISNGATTTVPQQKHGPPPPTTTTTISNGDTITTGIEQTKQLNNNAAGYATPQQSQQQQQQQSNNTFTNQEQKGLPPEGVKIVYTQGGQVMGAPTAAVIQQQNRQIPNGAIGISPQTVIGTTPSTIQQKGSTIVLKTPGGAPGLVTVPVNAVQQANNGTQGGIQTTTIGVASQPILPNLQVVNVRPQGAQNKGGQTRVVLSAAPGLVGARAGTSQLTLQSFHGLQPGQQGALLLKTENGQYQLLRVGPAPQQTANLTNQQGGAAPMTFRMQTVPAQTVSSAATNPAQAGATTTVSSSQPIVQTTQPVQRPANDNTKEKCRKFLANLLELSSREPKSVERNVRTLIQELIDNKVEPEDFCDKLERLLNASPQPCLIGFLKKSLPLLRHSLANNELSIDGIRPPPANVVFTAASPTVQTTVRATAPPVATQQQVRIVGPGVVRAPGAPGAVIQQRIVGPIRGPAVQQTRMVTAIRQPTTTLSSNIIQQQSISTSQPPALHPVYSGTPGGGAQNNTPLQQLRPAVPRPVQVRPAGQGRLPPQRVNPPSKTVTAVGKGGVISQGGASRPSAKEKEKKSFSAAYTGDDDINDVAAMGGVNLAEETQKILGSTEYVGTQIRSCKEDVMCAMGPLQMRIRQALARHGLDDPATGDVAACISHAAQERLRDIVEKLAVITEHRLEMVKSDSRYEVTNDIKGQLKFLEDLDKAERKKHEELEREMLLRAAKSRSKTEDPEQAKLKAKAKEMQRVEMEELRQREANATALQAIGPRKKPRLDSENMSNSQNSSSGGGNNNVRGQMPLRQRIKKVTMRDLQFLYETEKDLCRSKLLYRAYLK